MPTITISLAELFYEAWGYRTSAFDGQGDVKPVQGYKEGSRTELGRHGSPYYAKDALGREYYMPVEVQVGNDIIPGTNTTYAEALGVRNADGSTTGRWQLPYPVISASMNINVVDTQLTERNGMVSELISSPGYRIKIRGFMINKSNEFPEDDYDTLKRLVSLGIPFRINNPMTDILLADNGPDKLVTIRGVNFPERPGVKHVKPYELDLMAEVPFNLIDIS